MITLTPEQNDAIEAIKEWFRSPIQEFFLAGYAGTGKSTLVNYVVSALGIGFNEVAFCAYTGKAALVLTQKAEGKYYATTIHRLIYKVELVDEETDDIYFTLRPPHELEGLKLIVVDEASMVYDEIYEDLKSFGIKILFVGDHGQLPPVGSGNIVAQRIFTNPDVRLDTIHRQAEGNPIIHLSMLAREGIRIKTGVYENKVLVIPQGHPDINRACLAADQIIVGTNRNREAINNWYRSEKGFTDPLPVVGDKLICVRNNWKKSIRTANHDVFLVNGLIGYITKVTEANDRRVRWPALDVDFQPEHTKERFYGLFILKASFLDEPIKLDYDEYGLYADFTFGYAITCHKAQGSQWNTVLVFDESYVFREDRYRWLYTAITRASDRLILVV